MTCFDISRDNVVKLKDHSMTISRKQVSFDDDSMWVALSDGRILGVPLAWFPRLLHATPTQRAAVTLSPMGLHWDALDERYLGRRPHRRARRHGRRWQSGVTQCLPPFITQPNP